MAKLPCDCDFPDYVPPFLMGLFHYTGFVGFTIAFVTYPVGRKLAPERRG